MLSALSPAALACLREIERQGGLMLSGDINAFQRMLRDGRTETGISHMANNLCAQGYLVRASKQVRDGRLQTIWQRTSKPAFSRAQLEELRSRPQAVSGHGGPTRVPHGVARSVWEWRGRMVMGDRS